MTKYPFTQEEIDIILSNDAWVSLSGSLAPLLTFETQHLAVLTYTSGLHMLEQTAVSSRSGVSVIDIPSKEKK